jgi:hypothetical protein
VEGKRNREYPKLKGALGGLDPFQYVINVSMIIETRAGVIT